MVRKQGSRWHYDFMIRRIRYRGSVPEARTKQEALVAEAQKRREVFEGNYGRPRGEGSFDHYAVTVFLPWSKLNKRSWQTDAFHVTVLSAYFVGKSFREITPMLVEKFKKDRLNEVTTRGRQRSRASVNREIACLSKIFTLAIRDGKTETNPCVQVHKYAENNDRDRYLTYDEEKALLDALTGPREYLRPIIELAINTGMRKGELLKMEWGWVDFSRNCIYIPKHVAKSGKARQIPLNSNARDLLLTLEREREGAVVFASPRTKKALVDIKRSFTAACKDAGLTGLRFHDLRHTAATRLGATGADPFVIAEILGHADLRMTRRYTHASDDRKRAALEGLTKEAADVLPFAARKEG
jgi:integrase